MRWVPVKSEYQRLGLGRALIAKGVKRMVEIEGDCVMYIPTQIWNIRAIQLYIWAGFEFETVESNPCGYNNQTNEALPHIQHLVLCYL
ncbi:hypothetical protein OSO01_00320 [Oceanobacillus sojae]|uniref:N-acetyltransferase domain-containing protein n=2 Tax=Oceanobacillus sojae TaxID=582851 RepID=A0A511ZCY9_9BACI|nr:hypothetical protein OSO01_00320 [Oceanobacillus sojae]